MAKQLVIAAAATVLLTSCASAPTSRPEVWPAVKGIEGSVVAHLYVEPSGRVAKVKIVKSSHELLSQEVQAKAINYRFKAEEKPFIGELEVVFRR